MLYGGFVNVDVGDSSKQDGVIGLLQGRIAKRRISVRMQVVGEVE